MQPIIRQGDIVLLYRRDGEFIAIVRDVETCVFTGKTRNVSSIYQSSYGYINRQTTLPIRVRLLRSKKERDLYEKQFMMLMKRIRKEKYAKSFWSSKGRGAVRYYNSIRLRNFKERAKVALLYGGVGVLLFIGWNYI